MGTVPSAGVRCLGTRKLVVIFFCIDFFWVDFIAAQKYCLWMVYLPMWSFYDLQDKIYKFSKL